MRTVEVPERERPDDLRLCAGAGAEDAHHVQELLKVQSSAAITAEELHYARRKRIVQQLLDLDELLRHDKMQPS